jgi:hypothetical protein
VRAQYIDDVALAGARLPQTMRQLLSLEQRLDRDGGRRIEIVPALSVGMALDLAGMI